MAHVKTRIFLRLGILSGLVFLPLTMSSNSRFAIRNALICGGVCVRSTPVMRGRSFRPACLAADSVVCVVIIKRAMVAQYLRVAYVNLAILTECRTSKGVPKWNRENVRGLLERDVGRRPTTRKGRRGYRRFESVGTVSGSWLCGIRRRLGRWLRRRNWGSR
jgi:hypothetical protein